MKNASFVEGNAKLFEGQLDHCVETLTLGSSRSPDDISAWSESDLLQCMASWHLLNQEHKERKKRWDVASGAHPSLDHVASDAHVQNGNKGARPESSLRSGSLPS
jgi:hypothetical protein